MSLSVEAIAERYATSLQALSEIANAYYFQGRVDEAWHLFQAGEPWLSARETRSEDQVNFLLKYGEFLVHNYYLTTRAEDLMCSVVQRARQAAEASQDEAGIATSLYLTGQTLYYHNLLAGGGDYSRARDSFEQASALREKIGDSYHVAESLFYTGLTYDRENPDEQAKECYQRALSLAEQYGNTWAASEAMRHLTDYTDGEQRWRYAQRSLALREEMGFKVYIPSAQLLLSDIYIARDDLAQALDYCQQAEQLCREMNLQPYLMHALLTQGELAYKQGHLDEAREHVEQAARLAHTLNIAYGIAAAHEKLELLAHEQKS
jgi:tetratricopeptide (TPR) repeat protein